MSIVDLQARADALKTEAHANANDEMKAINRARWHGQVSAKNAAINRVSRATDYVERLLVMPDLSATRSEEEKEAKLVLASTQLDLAHSVITHKQVPEIRIARVQGYQPAIKKHIEEIDKSSALSTVADAASALKILSDRAKQASEFLIKLGKAPLEEVKLTAKLFQFSMADDVLSLHRFAKFHNFGKAAKFFGKASIVLDVVTIVTKTLADQDHWAEKFAVATVSAGTAIALSAVITGSATATLINASFVAAGLTAEIPPVAAALVAAGIVIIATVAITELFDTLVEIIFGKSSIHRSMRLVMSTPMYTQMSHSMSTEMAVKMYSIPK